MGNETSAPLGSGQSSSYHPTAAATRLTRDNNNNTNAAGGNNGNGNGDDDKAKYRSFPGSAILEKTFCGSIDTTDPAEYQDQTLANRLLRKADIMCVSSPDDNKQEEWHDRSTSQQQPQQQQQLQHEPPASSRLLARALVSEVTDNPNTMKYSELQARERKLLKAQLAAQANHRQSSHKSAAHAAGAAAGDHHTNNTNSNTTSNSTKKRVGAAGTGVGPPHVLQSFAYALTGRQDEVPTNLCVGGGDETVAGLHHHDDDDLLHTNNVDDTTMALHQRNPYAITIAVCMSRRSSTVDHAATATTTGIVGHADTITRQTAFDFNQLQDRDYKYVSATDPTGWRAGGGEGPDNPDHKIPQPDNAHIPILHMDCPNAQAVDQVIHALASGDIFIPHMAVLPDALSVQGSPLPDLTVRWNCERNDDVTPEQWSNWCLEFMHNQLYEYFYDTPANPVWMARPFSLTLARKVRWKTVKHMNKYFAQSEQVLEQWRQNGPQYLTPAVPYMDGGASAEEVARPHGIYLLRRPPSASASGRAHPNASPPPPQFLVPTNYFGPNFAPPYTTKMTRSLLENVLQKSWNKQRREWSSKPLPQLLSPGQLLAAACGCAADPGGFVAKEATEANVTTTPAAVSSDYYSGDSGVEEVEDDNDESFSEEEEEEEEDAYFAAREPEKEETPYFSDDDDDDDEDDDDDDENDESNDDERERSRESELSSFEDHTPASEEKKTDDVKILEKRAARMSLDASTSGFMSLAASGTTTVVHANHHDIGFVVPPETTPFSEQPQQQYQEPQRLYSDEDWASPVASAVSPEPSSDPPGEKVTLPSPMAGTSAQQLLEHEKRRQRDLVAKTQQEVAKTNLKPSSNYKMQAKLQQPRSSPKVESSASAASLEYSADGSTIFADQATAFTAETSLLGQQFATDGSVSTAGRPKLSTVRDSQDEDEDDDYSSAALSLQTSTSSAVSVVPTDEELFAAGWAKALDPKSGNYYYFTLDRTTTMWENPLTQSQPVDAPGA